MKKERERMTCRRRQHRTHRGYRQLHVQVLLRMVTNIVKEISNGIQRLSAGFFVRSGGIVIGVGKHQSLCCIRGKGHESEWVAPLAMHLHSVLPYSPLVTLWMRPAGSHGHRELRRTVLRLDHLLAQHGGGWLLVRCNMQSLEEEE